MCGGHVYIAGATQYFARIVAVRVHHGGIGTTAAALHRRDAGNSSCRSRGTSLTTARVAVLGVGLALRSRGQSSGHVSYALARLMAPDVGDRCRAIASRADEEDGLELTAGWVEELAGMAKRQALERNCRGVSPTGRIQRRKQNCHELRVVPACQHEFRLPDSIRNQRADPVRAPTQRDSSGHTGGGPRRGGSGISAPTPQPGHVRAPAAEQ